MAPRRTRTGRAMSCPRRPSTSHHWYARPIAAQSLAPARAQARGQVRNAQIQASFRGSLGRSGEPVTGFALPVSLLLERVGHLFRHVRFIVLGEHIVGLERAAGLERAFGDNPLPFAEEVREDSR